MEKEKRKSSLDEVIAKMNIEREKIMKEQEEADKIKREEEYKKTIEKIYEAVSAGNPEKACRILKEFAEKEGSRIAMTMPVNPRLPIRHVYGGRPSQTIFF